jgi:hypothetical protein
MKATVALATDETAKTLVEAVRQNPKEAVPFKMLVDRLQEVGVNAKSAVKVGWEIRLSSLPVQQWPVDRLRRLLKGTSAAAIEAALNAANGRRRERTVTLSEALWACKEARAKGYAVVGGGSVANSYKYPATQTGFVVAVGSKGQLRWRAGVVSASKGTSVGNQLAGITVRGSVEDWRRWADAATSPTAVMGVGVEPVGVAEEVPTT